MATQGMPEQQMQPPVAPVAQKPKTWKPVVGGVLILIGAVIVLSWGLALIGTMDALDALVLVDIEGWEMLSDLVKACGAIFIVLGLISVIGAIFAIMRKSFGLAIVGGILALPGAFIFALIGIILVAISKDEF